MIHHTILHNILYLPLASHPLGSQHGAVVSSPRGPCALPLSIYCTILYYTIPCHAIPYHTILYYMPKPTPRHGASTVARCQPPDIQARAAGCRWPGSGPRDNVYYAMLCYARLYYMIIYSKKKEEHYIIIYSTLRY